MNTRVDLKISGWIKPGDPIEPADKSLCIVIGRYGSQTPKIYQFRRADDIFNHCDYFLDVSEKWIIDSYEGGEWEPSFQIWGNISYWKPLGLPAEDDERILKEIESWFEEG